MNWDRVSDLLKLDEDLHTDELLRQSLPNEMLYLFDRRIWLKKVIERMIEIGEDDFVVADRDRTNRSFYAKATGKAE
jgi:hypothetical protein